MAKRRKTKLENFFSLKRHRRRMGARKALSSDAVDFKNLREKRISNGKQIYTHGSQDDLSQHLDKLRLEFQGQTELVYYHAKLNVLLRREFKTKDTFRKFLELWESECAFLLKNLNIRWLVSAADSFMDHSPDPTEQAQALAVVCLTNTIKLYETERFLNKSEALPYLTENVELLSKQRLPLFDGTSGFAIGTDDTLRNMRWRLETISQHSLTGKILVEVFNRLQEQETVYKRFKQRHVRKRTAWW